MFEPADEVIGSAGYLLMKAGTHVLAEIEASLGALGLTGREFLVLTFVGAEALSQQELSTRLGLDPAMIVGLVDNLEANDYVVRNRDEADRRRYILALTDKGRGVAQEAKAAVFSSEAAFLHDLDDGERRQLASLLLRIMRSRLAWLPED